MLWILTAISCINAHHSKEPVTVADGVSLVSEHFIESDLRYDAPTDQVVQNPMMDLHPGDFVYTWSDTDEVEEKDISEVPIHQLFIAMDGLYEPVLELHTIRLDGRIVAIKYIGVGNRLLYTSRPTMIPRNG